MRLEGRSSPAAMSHHSDDGMLGNPGSCSLFLRSEKRRGKWGWVVLSYKVGTRVLQSRTFSSLVPRAERAG